MPNQIKIVIDNKKIEKILLRARTTIDGNIMISDHPEIDIIVSPSKNKITAFPKNELDDEVHDTQKRLFDFLTKQGIVTFDTVQAGPLFMTMEATIPEVSGEGDKIQYCLYALSKFFEQEMPYYAHMEDFKKDMEDKLLEPEADEYTEFDPSRHHDAVKGSLPPRMVKYGIHSIYRV